jgi:hydroxymethylpyrimidine/phosphomethylpyrimidine kinase
MAQENTPLPTDIAVPDDSASAPPCVLVFNANDPSGAGGISADVLAAASVGAHALPVMTGAYMRDTAEIFDHIAFDEEAVAEQARNVLEDVSVQIIKVGFCGNPENLSVIAEICTDYADLPVVAYMPNLSWWEDDQIDAYLDAFRELILPQTTVLVGNHNTLWRWLLPDWSSEKSPSPRDIARAAAEMGVPYVLVTGINHPDQHVENALATAHTVMVSERFERFEAVFSGAGETLSITLAAVLAAGTDLEVATHEALSYLDQSLNCGFRPGMGNVLPDRLFWAELDDEAIEDDDGRPATAEDFSLPRHETKH